MCASPRASPRPLASRRLAASIPSRPSRPLAGTTARVCLFLLFFSIFLRHRHLSVRGVTDIDQSRPSAPGRCYCQPMGTPKGATTLQSSRPRGRSLSCFSFLAAIRRWRERRVSSLRRRGTQHADGTRCAGSRVEAWQAGLRSAPVRTGAARTARAARAASWAAVRDGKLPSSKFQADWPSTHCGEEQEPPPLLSMQHHNSAAVKMASVPATALADGFARFACRRAQGTE